ncbi:MAG TPA: AMP-binding protein [Burkholderiales bacterium]|nr:AMP-binding protein [Burkholderiales bacterium]
MAELRLGDVPSHHAARKGPGTWCVAHGGEALSWGELDARATRRAWALRARGVGQDDVVVLAVPNSNALYELTFALWKLGATPAMVSARLPVHELKAIVELAAPRAVIAAEPGIVAATGALTSDFGREFERHDPMPSGVAKYWKVMTSGGSTGRPKLIVARAPSAFPEDREVLNLPRDKVILNPGPCHHNMPFAMTHLGLLKGNSIVGMQGFDAEEALLLVDKYKVAWVNCVPTMMNRIWLLPEDVKKRYDLSSIEAVWHTASPMAPRLKQAWIDWLGPERIWEIYGSTEGAGATTLNGVEWLAHRGSVGKPAATELRIQDENGKALPPRTVGEIYMKVAGGAENAYHYVGAERRRTEDGFESLGDFGWMDEDGYLYLAGRRTDLMLVGGANVYPAEIEAALIEHPGVETAVVIGLPDDDMGELPHAIINRNLRHASQVSAEELGAFLETRLAKYKIPRAFEFVTEPLRDDAGKVRRSRLREERVKS